MKLVSGIVDSGFFAQSALSAEVATKDSLGRNISETYLTGVDIPESANWNSTYNTVHDNSASWTGGGVTGDFTLVEGNGIQLTDDPIAQTTTISVSGDYATNTQLQTVSADITAMIPTALTGDYLDKASADTLYYPLNSNPNNYLTTAYTPEFAYHDTAISGIDNSALYDTSAHARINTLAGRISTLSSDKQDITGMTAYATVESLTAKQDAGDYLSASDSANFLLTSDSGNFYTTANESGFITGVDLTPYQTVEGMTAYQPVGSYLTTADSANFYTTANESGFISEVPDTYLQNTDLSTTDGKVTAISGIPLSAGGEVPEGVMAESGLEYNAVDEISGYNGSAFAQYGAEKQWLVHDDTIVHVSNSAQYAFGCNISALQRLMGIDETELLDSTATSAFTLTEPLSGFNAVKIKLRWWDKVPDNYYDVERFTTGKLSLSWTYFDNVSDANPLELAGASWTSNNGINYNLEAGVAKVFSTGSTAIGNFTHTPWPLSIIGIGRKEI